MLESKLTLVSSNSFKAEEFSILCETLAIPHRVLSQNLVEINDIDIIAVARRKAIDAFRVLRIPLLVEHGGLYIDHWRGLPGPLSKPFWDSVGGKLCDLVPAGAKSATAKSAVAYCDGAIVKTFVGELVGAISDAPRGARSFQWDPVFIPNSESRTLAELTATERAALSHAAAAYSQLFTYLGLP